MLLLQRVTYWYPWHRLQNDVELAFVHVIRIDITDDSKIKFHLSNYRSVNIMCTMILELTVYRFNLSDFSTLQTNIFPSFFTHLNEICEQNYRL